MKGKFGSFFQNLRNRPGTSSDVNLLDPWEVRTHSIEKAEQLGYPTNQNLPPRDKPSAVRSEDDIFRRMMCVFITSACAYGVDREDGLDWLKREGFADALTPHEKEFLDGEDGKLETFQSRVEALFVLAWSLSYVRHLDYREGSDDDFVHLFPNLKTGQTAASMREKARLRPLDLIFKHLDLAYCLHWAIVDARVNGKKMPGDAHPAVIEQRRWALEWLLEDVPWDDVPMDT